MSRSSFAPFLALAVLAVLAGCDEVDDPIDANVDPEAVIDAEVTGVRGQLVELDGSFSSDADDDALTFEWAFTSRPAGSAATITDAADAVASFLPDAIGEYTVALTVSDGDADDVASETITIDIQTLGLITSDSIIRNTTSPPEDADYRVADFTLLDVDGAAVVIEPGVTISMEEASGVYVDVDGSLSAVGTAALPIRFIGSADSAGHWDNVTFDGNEAANRLSHVEIAYGGGNEQAALEVSGAVAIDNTLVRNSADYGLEASNISELPGFASNEFRDNALAPLRIPTDLMTSLDAASVYASGNNPDRIVVGSGDMVLTAGTWPATDAPFLLEDFATVDVTAPIEVDPGFHMLMGEGSGIYVDPDGGTLVAEGSPTDSIHFEGAQATPGYWNGIEVDSNTGNTLMFTRVGYGGGNGFGMLLIGGSLTVVNSHIHHSADYGVEVAPNATYNQSNVTYEANQGGNVLQ